MFENAYMIGMKGKEKIKDWILALVFLLIAIIALVIPYNSWFNGQKVFSGYHLINVEAGEKLLYNELGDFVGGVIGTVVAGIACILVYITYKGQRDELKKTNETAKTQQFETMFFNLIHIHKESLEAIKITRFRIPEYLPRTAEQGLIDIGVQTQYEDGELSEAECKKYLKEMQGEVAMYAEFEEESSRRGNVLAKYFQFVWFSDICLILEYLIANSTDNIYQKFFYAQIAKPEWWILYGIFLYGDKFQVDKPKYDNYVKIVDATNLFDYGIAYLSEKYNVTPGNLYDKNFNHKKL